MRRVIDESLVIVRRELLHYARERAYWVGQLALPLVFVAFLGLGLNDLVELPSGTSYLAHLATGLLMLTVGSGAVGGGFTLIQERDAGFLRVLLVAPISRASLVLGKVAARSLASLVLVAVLLGVLALFTPLGLPHPGAALGAVLGVTVTLLALGLGLAATLRSLESFRVLAALVTVPLYLLCGIFYPLEALRAPLRWLAYVNPLTYGVELFRYGLLGVAELPLPLSAAVLGVGSLLALALAVWLFERGEAG